LKKKLEYVREGWGMGGEKHEGKERGISLSGEKGEAPMKVLGWGSKLTPGES